MKTKGLRVIGLPWCNRECRRSLAGMGNSKWRKRACFGALGVAWRQRASGVSEAFKSLSIKDLRDSTDCEKRLAVDTRVYPNTRGDAAHCAVVVANLPALTRFLDQPGMTECQFWWIGSLQNRLAPMSNTGRRIGRMILRGGCVDSKARNDAANVRYAERLLPFCGTDHAPQRRGRRKELSYAVLREPYDTEPTALSIGDVR